MQALTGVAPLQRRAVFDRGRFVDACQQLAQHDGGIAATGARRERSGKNADNGAQRQGLQGRFGGGPLLGRAGRCQVIPATVGLAGGLGHVGLPCGLVLPVIDQVPGRRRDLEIAALHRFAGELFEHHALLQRRRRCFGICRARTRQRAQHGQGQRAGVLLQTPRLEQPQHRMRHRGVALDELADAVQRQEALESALVALREPFVVEAAVVRKPGQLVHARLARVVDGIVEGAALEQLLLHHRRAQHLQQARARRCGLGFQRRQRRGQFVGGDVKAQQARLDQAQCVQPGFVARCQLDAGTAARPAFVGPVAFVDFDHHLAGRHLAGRPDMHGAHRARHRRVDDGFHLHGLEREDARTRQHAVSRLHMDLRHRGRQLGAHAPVRHPAEAVRNALHLDIHLGGCRGALHGIAPATEIEQQRALAGAPPHALCLHHGLPCAAAHAHFVRAYRPDLDLERVRAQHEADLHRTGFRHRVRHDTLRFFDEVGDVPAAQLQVVAQHRSGQGRFEMAA